MMMVHHAKLKDKEGAYSQTAAVVVLQAVCCWLLITNITKSESSLTKHKSF